jgi:hypothetical protein
MPSAHDEPLGFESDFEAGFAGDEGASLLPPLGAGGVLVVAAPSLFGDSVFPDSPFAESEDELFAPPGE